MTGEQWMQIVEWVTDRYPDNPWRPEQAVAYYNDVKDRDATDVWAGLMGLYEAGQRFAPNGSQILAATIEQARLAARDDMYRRELPAVTIPVDVDSYSQRRYGEQLSAVALIERIHAETRCNQKACPIHNEEER